MAFKTERADWLFIVPATIFWVSSVVLSLLDLDTRRKRKSHRRGSIRAVGVTLVLAGALIRLLARRALGRYYFYGLRTAEGQVLVTSGVYSWIRHPGYLGSLLVYLGTPLVFASLRGFLVALPLVPAIVYRMGIEENMLIDRFGDEYREYRKQTKRLIPHVY